MYRKNKLKALIADNQIEKVIEALLKIGEVDKTIHNDVIFQSARYKEYKETFLNQLESNENLEIKAGKIKRSLLEIIDRIPEERKSESIKRSNLPKANKGENSHFILAIIPILSIFTFLGVIIFMPCPTPTQYNFLRILLPLLIASIGSFIFFAKIRFKEYLAILSSLLLFVIIYFFDPAQQMVANKCENEPFEYTIHFSPSLKNNIYPKLQSATLKLRLENKFEVSKIDENGDADFKGISAKFKNKKLGLVLDALYWQLDKDSVVLDNKATNISISPDGSLSKIHGKVLDMEFGRAIESANVECQGVSSSTDISGAFLIEIPLLKQQIEYDITAFKAGYNNFSGTATPATNESLIILLSNQ